MAETLATQPSVTFTATNSPRTTAWAGAAIALGAALTLVSQFGRLLSAELGAMLLATLPVDLLLADLLFALAALILAFGWWGERSAVGSSTVGKVALIAFGVLPLVNIALGRLLMVLPVGADDLWLLVANLALAAALLGFAAGVVAGIAILRARVLRGIAGGALLAVALWDVGFFALQVLPDLLLTPEARNRLVESWNAAGFVWVVAAGTLLRLLWGGAYLIAARRP